MATKFYIDTSKKNSILSNLDKTYTVRVNMKGETTILSLD